MKSDERRRYGNEYREEDQYSKNRGRRFENRDYDRYERDAVNRNRNFERERYNREDEAGSYESDYRSGQGNYEPAGRDYERERFRDEPGYRNANRGYGEREYRNRASDHRESEYNRNESEARYGGGFETPYGNLDRDYNSGGSGPSHRGQNAQYPQYGDGSDRNRPREELYDAHPTWRQESHRGKGPKGYSRSDSRIHEDISDALSDSHDVDATDIEVKVSDGTAILSGTVDSRRAKRCAEDCLENVSGIRNIENRLHLRSENENRTQNDQDFGKTANAANDKKQKNANAHA